MLYRLVGFAACAVVTCSPAFADDGPTKQIAAPKQIAPPTGDSATGDSATGGSATGGSATDVSAAVTRALDFLSAELAKDPQYGKTPRRRFYAPIVYAPLSGLAFLGSGSTRVEGPYAESLRHVLAYVMKHGGRRKANQDAVNKAVGANICSLTHNAGYSAMFLAQLIDSEFPARRESRVGGQQRAVRKLEFSETQIRAKLRECCKTLEDLQSNNGGWQHGSGGPNGLGYTHLMAATITAMNGLAMARQVGVDVDRTVIDKGLAYIRKASSDGRIGYAVGNRGSFSAGRNAGVLQVLYRLRLQDDKLVEPVLAELIKNLAKAETGHGSPLWHLLYTGLATAHISPEARRDFDSLYRTKLLRGQQRDGSIRAPEKPGTKPGQGEENRVWGALYTTPSIVLALQASYRQDLLVFDFRPDAN